MSMSLYSKLEKQSIPVLRYRKRIGTLFEELIPYIHDWKSPTLFPEDILDSKPLFILVASSKGLCGSFNANLIRYFDQVFLLEDHQTPTFITVGKKMREFFEKKNLGTLLAHHESLTTLKLVEIADGITQSIFKSEENYTSVTFFSNHLKNFFTQIPQKTILIPLDTQEAVELEKTSVQQSIPAANKQVQKAKVTFEEEPLWEQSKEEIMNEVALRYVKSRILDILLDSLRAEQAARFMAMDHSTTNAEKYLERLTLEYNKSRQALITREVSELSAGFAKDRE